MTLHLSRKCRSSHAGHCIILWRKGFKFFTRLRKEGFALRGKSFKTDVFVRRFKSCDLIRNDGGTHA